MATVTLNYNSNNALALSILDLINRTSAFTVVKDGKKAKSALSVSLRQAKNGKVNTYQSVDDFFKKIEDNV